MGAFKLGLFMMPLWQQNVSWATSNINSVGFKVKQIVSNSQADYFLDKKLQNFDHFSPIQAGMAIKTKKDFLPLNISVLF